MSVTTDQLINNVVHIGRPTYKWNPKMKKFIAGSSQGVHIFDVGQIKSMMETALDFLQRSSNEGRSFLLVGTKFQVSDLTEKMGQELMIPYVHHKWLAGLLTNFETVKKRIQYLKSIEEMQMTGEIEKYTKKERLHLDKEKNNLLLELGGVKHMDRLPDIVIVFDAHKEHIAVAEAQKLGLTIVAVVNTNSNPDNIKFPILANDTSRKSLQFIIEEMKGAFGKKAKAAPAAAMENTPEVTEE